MPKIHVMNDFDVVNLPISGNKDGMKQIFIAHKLFAVYPLMNMDASNEIEDDIFLMHRLDYDIYMDRDLRVYKVECDMKNMLPYHLVPFECAICNSQVQMLDDIIVCEKCEEVIH